MKVKFSKILKNYAKLCSRKYHYKLNNTSKLKIFNLHFMYASWILVKLIYKLYKILANILSIYIFLEQLYIKFI